MESIEQLNQERIKKLGVKECYKYLVILEADTIKQVKMKEKTKKNISGERENFSKLSSVAEISSKE